MKWYHAGAGITILLSTLLLTGVVLAEDVIRVRFPQGEQKECSSPVLGSFTVQGPGLVTITIHLSPYLSLGFVPNIPVGFRITGSNNRFAGVPLPGGMNGKAFQLGEEVQNYRDKIPIEFITSYKLIEDREYKVEVQASPQCRMLYQGTFWQEGQEVRVTVKSEGANVTITSPPPQEETVSLGDALTTRIWQFGRSDGTVLVSGMRLLPDGRIEGSAHPNESRWGLIGNELVFYDGAGNISTRYNSFMQESGRWVISGPFLLWGNITHVLREVGELTPVHVPGTGYWALADVVEHAWGALPGPNASITGTRGRLHSLRSGVDVLRDGTSVPWRYEADFIWSEPPEVLEANKTLTIRLATEMPQPFIGTMHEVMFKGAGAIWVQFVPPPPQSFLPYESHSAIPTAGFLPTHLMSSKGVWLDEAWRLHTRGIAIYRLQVDPEKWETGPNPAKMSFDFSAQVPDQKFDRPGFPGKWLSLRVIVSQALGRVYYYNYKWIEGQASMVE